MKHKIQRVTADLHPLEIVRVELIPENDEEKKSINSIDQTTQDYLSVILEVVEILEKTPPFFTVKKSKFNIGFGK